MSASRRAILGQAELALLRDLDIALPYLRRDVEMAGIVGTFPHKRSSRNLLLNYALDRARDEPLERVVFLISDALYPSLDLACNVLLRRPLHSGRGRARLPIDPDFALLVRFRSEFLAHPIKLGYARRAALDAVVVAHGNTYNLLLRIIDKTVSLFHELRVAGLYKSLPTHASTQQRVPRFTSEDVARLVAAANEVTPLPADDGSGSHT